MSLQVMAKPHTSPVVLGEEFEGVASWSHLDKDQWWYLHDPDLVQF